MINYNYTRTLNSETNLYNIDSAGESVRLSSEIQTNITSKILTKIYCNASILIITFTTTLTAGEKTTLDDLITNHV